MKKVLSFVLAISVFISGSQLCAFAKTKEDPIDNIYNVYNTRPTPSISSRAKKMLKEIGTATVMTASPILATFLITFALSKAIQAVSKNYNLMKARKDAGIIEVSYDPIKTLKDFEFAMEGLKGQEKVKEQLKSIILGIVDKNAKYAKHGGSKQVGPGAEIIYMIGPSGVGKSFTAEILRKMLNGTLSNPFIIEASDIDRQSKSSPTEQLFGMRTKHAADKEYYEQSPVVSRIEATPNMTIVINEYDKLSTPELDEKLRTIKDQGYINVNGKKIDCSGLTIIITSNESLESIISGNLDTLIVDDGTGSRTHVKHDRAFGNRIKLVVFDNLTKEAYEEIALPKFNTLVQDLKEEYDINVNLGDTVRKISKKVEEINQGARPIFDFIDNLNTAILNNVVLKRACDDSYKGLDIDVDYDEATNEFIIEEHVREVPSTLSSEGLIAA